jgi:hypothetical protein
MKIASEVGISAAARIARGPVKKALLQAVAEFDADVLIIGRTSERVSRTIRRLDVCRSQGLAFPRGIWVFDPAYRCGAVPDSHRISFNVPLGNVTSKRTTRWRVGLSVSNQILHFFMVAQTVYP